MNSEMQHVLNVFKGRWNFSLFQESQIFLSDPYFKHSPSRSPCINMVLSPAVFRWIPNHTGRIGTVGWISFRLVESNKTDLIPRQEEAFTSDLHPSSHRLLNQHISRLMFDRPPDDKMTRPITPFLISWNSIDAAAAKYSYTQVEELQNMIVL